MALSPKQISKTWNTLKQAGSVTDSVTAVHYDFAQSLTNIEIESESVAEDPHVSISRRSLEPRLAYGTAQYAMF